MIIIALTKKLLSDRYYSWHLDMFNHWIFKKIPTMVDFSHFSDETSKAKRVRVDVNWPG